MTTENYYGSQVARPEGAATKDYRIAKVFAQDHWERACGLSDEILSENQVWYTVRMDVAGFSDMLTDADYYSDPYVASEMGMSSLAQSAKRVLAALLNQGAPEGYTVERRGLGYCVVNADGTTWQGD